jgi:hypothetical protein
MRVRNRTATFLKAVGVPKCEVIGFWWSWRGAVENFGQRLENFGHLGGSANRKCRGYVLACGVQ